MKTIMSIFLGTLLLASCNYQQINNRVDKKIDSSGIQNKDSAKNDISPERAHGKLNNPFRDINNFEMDFGDRFIDSLHALYSSHGQGKVTFTKDICIGDNCESYKTIVNKQHNTILYLFKGDGSEYGFSNDQYFLNKDSLVHVRNFSVSIHSWPTDSTETEWKIEDIVYRFQDDATYIETRTVITPDLDQFDFTLRGVRRKVRKDFNLKNIYQEKSLELETLLKMKDSEYRE